MQMSMPLLLNCLGPYHLADEREVLSPHLSALTVRTSLDNLLVRFVVLESFFFKRRSIVTFFKGSKSGV